MTLEDIDGEKIITDIDMTITIKMVGMPDIDVVDNKDLYCIYTISRDIRISWLFYT